MSSHFLHLLVYSSLVSTFFAALSRGSTRDRVKLGAIVWLALVGGTLVLAYAMYPFPR